MANEENNTEPSSSPPQPSVAAVSFSQAFEEKWKERLARSEKGKLIPELSNVFAILQNDVNWKGVLGYDEFSGLVVKLREPPFTPGERGEWGDLDDARLRLWVSQHYGMAPKKEIIFDAVQLAADRNRFHIVRNYLDALEWDGVDRVRYWLRAYLGAQAAEGSRLEKYLELVAIKWLVAAVARVYRPGCKADNVLILEGPQELGKSATLRILFGEWFTDAFFKIGDVAGYQIIRGKWGCELGELDNFNRAENSSAKLFFTQQIDRYRSPWGKRPADVPRQCVFAGTVNHYTYFKDETGNRRYWPVRCTRADLDDLRKDRDQLWAEAVKLYKGGCDWMVEPENRDIFREQQDARFMADAYEERIQRWLKEHPERATLKVNEVLGEALALDTARWTLAEQQRVGRCMARLGWERRKEKTGDRAWYYEKPSAVPLNN